MPPQRTPGTLSRTLAILGFLILFVFLFGLIFNVPLLIFLLVKLGILSPESLTEKRPLCYLGIFVFSAVLTPPDVISQLMMAFPMLLLYELGLLLAKLFIRKKTELQ